MDAHHKYHSSKIKKLIDDLDWDCSDQFHQKSSLNILHWYPASFITAIPGNIIDVFSDIGDVVWDPFCGSGTTAIEAYRKGRYFYGSDINDIALFISRAKLNLLKNKEVFGSEIAKVKSDLQQLEFELNFNNQLSNLSIAGKEASHYVELKSWYNPDVLYKLTVLWGYLQKYKTDPFVMYPLFAIFLNIAKVACAQQKTWGHIADNVKPNKEQVNLVRNSVFSSFVTRAFQVYERAQRLLMISNDGSFHFDSGDARYYRPPKLVDLVITSPPYPNMADYITSQRLSYYWLGHDIEYINNTKQSEIGARHLRHNNSRNITYKNAMMSAFDNIVECIKPKDGLLALLMPDYAVDENRKPIIDSLYEHLELKLNRLYTINRNVDELNRWAPFKKLKNETLTIWRKE